MDKAVLTCSLNGVLTNPKTHPVPVTPEEMAASAKEAYDAGATVMHIHYRCQEPDLGGLPSWDGALAKEMADAIRDACPNVVINSTTGIVGEDVSGPIDCVTQVKPEIAACNAGSLNYLKLKRDGSWAWPPMLFDNPVEKIQKMIDSMDALGAHPEFECFDVGIVPCVNMYIENGMATNGHYNFVMGVASGMPLDARLLPLLLEYKRDESPWQTTLIGRADIWPVHQATAELGGMLRTGLEDTFYLPDGERATGNGVLIEQLAQCAKNAGREIASPKEARKIMGLAGG